MIKQIQGQNPILPGWEYIPDVEPRLFEDRVYLYGSHDRAKAPFFCLNNYVCWSAAKDQLYDWKYEGIIYQKIQDPKNKWGIHPMFAPDVVKGVDGKFYLYYGLGFTGIIGVAVCDTPAGNFQFLSHVKYQDNTIYGRGKKESFPFDPAVIVAEEKVYLYTGFYLNVPSILTGFRRKKVEGGYVTRLSTDMFTIKETEKLLFPKRGEKSFPGHEFFEASSIRNIDGRYYFVYSSKENHELCYAYSDYLDRDFVFGGCLISNGDILMGQSKDRARNYWGNNHGGMLELDGKYYIFYHRQTNRHSYSRQVCCEQLQRTDSGHFLQAQMTSSGLNQDPLKGKGSYEARIACHLYKDQKAGRYDRINSKYHYRKHPYFTQDEKDGLQGIQYIKNMRNKAVAGFRYFDLEKTKGISITVSGKAKGTVYIYSDEDKTMLIGKIQVNVSTKKKIEIQAIDWNKNKQKEEKKAALYFVYEGKGKFNFYAFSFS